MLDSDSSPEEVVPSRLGYGNQEPEAVQSILVSNCRWNIHWSNTMSKEEMSSEQRSLRAPKDIPYDSNGGRTKAFVAGVAMTGKIERVPRSRSNKQVDEDDLVGRTDHQLLHYSSTAEMREERWREDTAVDPVAWARYDGSCQMQC